jgi:hypothetical protein
MPDPRRRYIDNIYQQMCQELLFGCRRGRFPAASTTRYRPVAKFLTALPRSIPYTD